MMQHEGDSRVSGELVEPGKKGDKNDKGELSPGDRAGEYVITDLLARGGCGSVYRARHVETGEPAAVKVLHDTLALLPKMVERFAREVQVVSMLRHPNIVEMFEVGQIDDGRPFYAMELLHGRTLSVVLEEEGRMSPSEALEILEPVCRALSAAHGAGVIHRDVKASNIMVTETENEGRRVKLLDFGIAKLIGPQAGSHLLTSEGRQVGTLTIMAPEQLLGGPVDARVDVYALGVLLYRLLTGKLPFDGKNALTLAQQHLEEPAPRPSQRIPLSPALDAVVLRSMEKRPEQRYDSAHDFLVALRRAASGARRVGDTLPPAPALGAGVYVDVRMDADADDIDDALGDDVGMVLDIAEEEMRAAGFVLAATTGSSVLGVCPLPLEPDASLRARRAIVDAAAALHETIIKRPGADPRVHANVCVHVDALVFRAGGSEVAGGPLVRTDDWAPRDLAIALTATSAALEGITGYDVTPRATAPGAADLFTVMRSVPSRGIA
jgi:serine/threonine-protein kinase